MSDGGVKNMLGDARVTLSSSEPDCVMVASDLSSSLSYDYRAVDGGGCTSATITATFTLGAWVAQTNATVYIVRPRSMSVAASLYPGCGASADILYTVGCASPAVRQRVQFSAFYTLESDDSEFSLGGRIDLAHSQVTIALTNMQVVAAGVYEGLAAGGR